MIIENNLVISLFKLGFYSSVEHSPVYKGFVAFPRLVSFVFCSRGPRFTLDRWIYVFKFDYCFPGFDN